MGAYGEIPWILIGALGWGGYSHGPFTVYFFVSRRLVKLPQSPKHQFCLLHNVVPYSLCTICDLVIVVCVCLTCFSSNTAYSKVPLQFTLPIQTASITKEFVLPLAQRGAVPGTGARLCRPRLPRFGGNVHKHPHTAHSQYTVGATTAS